MPPRANSSKGLTLVEVVVALVVFGVGMLGLGSAMLVLMRQARATQIQSIATDVAASRLERLVFTSCGTRTAGSDQFRGVESSWSVDSRLGSSAMLVTHGVQFALPNGIRSREYHAGVPCR
jgi:prepilin-type N-terminal cleavage/methylation domain-containing protein